MGNYGYIYKTTNVITDKIYIGKRKGQFNPNYLGSGLHLKHSINKHGKNNFKLEIIIYANDKNKLNELEKTYIAEYRNKFGKDKLYNIADGGDGFTGNPETIDKIRLANTGKKRPEKFKKKMKNVLGKLWENPEYRKHMSEVHRGKKHSPEDIKKISLGMVKHWNNR